MKDRRGAWGGGILAAFCLAAIAAPWLGLRDPAAQPDGLVLRDLPPLSRARVLQLADGSVRYAQEIRLLQDGTIEYRRGLRWHRVEADELAGSTERRPLYLLGTDRFGRDLLSRLVHGARVSLLVGFVAAGLALGLGALVGSLSALGSRWVDTLLMRCIDLMLSVPRLFLALLLVGLFGASLTTTVLVLGGTSWMAAARLVRGQLLSLREREFVAAARASGASRWRLGIRHLLPGALAPLIVESALRVGDAILLEAALSFLGLGVPPPAPSWGNLIAEGRDSLLSAWWIATLPGLAIVLTVIALHLVGEATREHFAAQTSRA